MSEKRTKVSGFNANRQIKHSIRLSIRHFSNILCAVDWVYFSIIIFLLIDIGVYVISYLLMWMLADVEKKNYLKYLT